MSTRDHTSLILPPASRDIAKSYIFIHLPAAAIGPYSTTVFDYVRWAMPFARPHSLTDSEVYAVTAYLLSLNGIIGEQDVMNAETLPKVKMPNRDNFILVQPWKPRVQ